MMRPIDSYSATPTALVSEPEVPLEPKQIDDRQTVPAKISPEVRDAVDDVISADSTPKQRRAAYQEVQSHYNLALSDGAWASPDPAAHRVSAIGYLTEAGIPTKFDPEVIAAVDQAVHLSSSNIESSLEGATDAQILEGYRIVQNHVDGIGGISELGISADALPARADAWLNDHDIPTTTAAVTSSVEDALEGLDDLDSQDKVAAVAEAAQRLDESTEGMSSELAALTVQRNMSALRSAFEHKDAFGGIPIPTPEHRALLESFARLSDRLAGTDRGDKAVRGLADLVMDGYVSRPPINYDFLAEQGVGLPLLLAIAENISEGDTSLTVPMREIDSAIDQYAKNKVEPAVDAYTEHTAELNWLLQNLGPGATPAQIQQATEDYIADHPGWQKEHDELQADVASRGKALLKQIDGLRDLPEGLDDKYTADADAKIKSLLEDKKTGFAIATAAGSDPEAIASLDLPKMIGFTERLGLSDKGLSVVKALATAHIQHNVLGSLATLDASNPAALQAARAQIASLRNPAIATALGIDPAKLHQLDGAVDELQKVLPQNGETLSQADVQTRLTRLNTQLDKLSAFASSQPLGQVFRGIGVASGVASLWGNTSDFVNNPSLDRAIKSLTDAAGLSMAVGDLAAGMGVIPETSPWARFSASSTFGKVLGTVGIGISLVGVADSLSDGDLAQAGIGAVGLGGSALALFGSAVWAGPAGMVIALIAAGTSFGLNAFRAQQAEGELEEASRPFLRAMGLNSEAAGILSDFSSDGHSSMLLMAQYAQYKGYDLAKPEDQKVFVEWINDMSPTALTKLRDALNDKIDEYGGDPSKLGSDTEAPPAEYRHPDSGNTPPAFYVLEPDTVGEIDGFLSQRGRYAGGDVLPQAG